MKTPEYKFTHSDTVLFITGVPLSGKSTVAPLVAASIESCTVQPMDIFRLISQKLEEYKPEKERNPFVQVGSCDSYTCVGDGRYTPENLIIGFNKYAEVVCALLEVVIPKLEVRGVRNVIFEGVQLTPEIVAPYIITRNNRLIIVTSSENKLAKNRRKLFGNDRELQEQYSGEKLMLLQDEILRQSQTLPKETFKIIDNTGEYTQTVDKLLQYLLESKVITVSNEENKDCA